MSYDPTNGLSAHVEARRQTPTGNAVNVQIGPGDPISNVPVVILFEHHQVHEGEAHRAQSVQASLGTTTVKYGITVPVFANTVGAPHVIFGADVYNGAVQVNFYEAATYTGGSPITPYNRNRNLSAVAPAMTISGGVTSTDGTLVESRYIGAGTRSAAGDRATSEWLLKSNTKYRIDLIGLVANTQAILDISWYEDLGV